MEDSAGKSSAEAVERAMKLLGGLNRPFDADEKLRTVVTDFFTKAEAQKAQYTARGVTLETAKKEVLRWYDLGLQNNGRNIDILREAVEFTLQEHPTQTGLPGLMKELWANMQAYYAQHDETIAKLDLPSPEPKRGL